MLPLSSIEVLSDRIRLVTHTNKGTVELLYSSIPANVINQPVATVESWVNTWLASNVVNMQVRVHIFSLAPLSLTTICVNMGEPIFASWWSIP